MAYVRTYETPGAWVHEHDEFVHTVFRQDRSSSVFAPPHDDSGAFLYFAHEMGYGDGMRYAVEHELAHHFVALASGKPYSLVVWLDAHKQPVSLDDKPVADEEHLANWLLKYVNMGRNDEQFGKLNALFGPGLPRKASEFIKLARPWLD